MSNLEKINEILRKDPDTVKKLSEEMLRLSEGKDPADKAELKEIMAKAAKTVFGLELTDEELEESLETAEKPVAAPGEAEKMNMDELDQVAGGADKKDLPSGKQLAKFGFFSAAFVGNMAEAVNTAIFNPFGAIGGVLIFGRKAVYETEEACDTIDNL